MLFLPLFFAFCPYSLQYWLAKMTIRGTATIGQLGFRELLNERQPETKRRGYIQITANHVIQLVLNGCILPITFVLKKLRSSLTLYRIAVKRLNTQIFHTLYELHFPSLSDGTNQLITNDVPQEFRFELAFQYVQYHASAAHAATNFFQRQRMLAKIMCQETRSKSWFQVKC